MSRQECSAKTVDITAELNVTDQLTHRFLEVVDDFVLILK